MKISRRGFVAGGVAAGASVPAAWYLYGKFKPKQGDPEQEPEPAVIVPPLEEALLARRLIGIWDFHVLEGGELFADLQSTQVELLLDVGPGGRALRGRLRPRTDATSGADEGWRVYGELASDKLPNLRWKLVSPRGSFDCLSTIDEVWGDWAAGLADATISGTAHRCGTQSGYSTSKAVFVARRRPFVEARQRINYRPELQGWLMSPGHRLFHQLWHASRDKWHKLTDERRNHLRVLGWQPGKANLERAARGPDRHRNGSGEDFLFMHRRMLGQVRVLQDFPSWRSLPAPRPYIEHGVDAFANYVMNVDGLSVPPAWEAPGDAEFNQWLRNIKSSEGYYGNIQLWEAQFQNPEYLSTLCLGELGSRIELGIHDWLHMRWASVGRDPNSGAALIYDRNPIDYAERFFRAENDYLGDPFSSHLNPVFWLFHGWIDDRIEDWYLAHEQFHPGEVQRQRIDDIAWFAPGPWVRVAQPWLGPAQAGCGAWGRSNRDELGVLDMETMKLALQVVFSEEEEAKRLGKQIPRRPFYARQLSS
jgi:hypothetical protein